MTCKHDHSGHDGIPAFLCRRCHPVIPVSREAHAVPDETGGDKDADSVKRDKLRHQLDAERIKVRNMQELYGSAARTAIDKQHAKIARLEKKLVGVADGLAAG